MKKIILMLVFILSLPGLSTAEDVAGWDKAKWGMTKDELLSIYGEQVRDIKDNAGIDERIYLRGISVGGNSFECVLVVDEQKLKEVRLEAVIGKYPVDDYEKIKTLLTQKYGKADNEEDDSKYFGPGMSIISKRSFWFKGPTTIILNLLASQGTNSLVIRYQPATNLEGI